MTIEQAGEHAVETHSEEEHVESVHVDAPNVGPTAAQLRRFIKSRPYVPLHETSWGPSCVTARSVSS